MENIGLHCGISLNLCLPKKFHASCTIGVQWNPDFKKSCGYKDLTQINKVALKLVINEQLKLKNKGQTQQKIRKCSNYA